MQLSTMSLFINVTVDTDFLACAAGQFPRYSLPPQVLVAGVVAVTQPPIQISCTPASRREEFAQRNLP